jgi:phosphoribosylglycinamide formyltransferase-1
MNSIAVFASGTGSNARRLMDYFSPLSESEIRLLLTNNRNAGAIEHARIMNVPVRVFDRDEFYSSQSIVDLLLAEGIDWIVLAGFLLLVPPNLIRAFPRRIVNIHPALLPEYGGKGMYGMNVHQAVIRAGERFSGITIHYVNEEYDRGDIIFKAAVEIADSETPESLAGKIHELEYRHFPPVLEQLFSIKDEKF